ncbi:hypothetical protein HZH66_015354 [Vespula vulgaris]|uniref:Uncharacterized protein n=1 Tax=Vespula vulgaris TaxID=7454 RepID=A0A834J0T4_VESVU|nr:hypothetical protein HZH66_015354 [Vespula vulgaris]
MLITRSPVEGGERGGREEGVKEEEEEKEEAEAIRDCARSEARTSHRTFPGYLLVFLEFRGILLRETVGGLRTRRLYDPIHQRHLSALGHFSGVDVVRSSSASPSTYPIHSGVLTGSYELA